VILHGDACRLPIRDQSIDLVLTSPPSELDQESRGLAFAEIARVCRGRVVILANIPGQRLVDGFRYPACPEGYVRALVGLNSDPGDVVLDCFTGTGVIPRVAAKMGRRAIGLDLDPGCVAYAATHQ
jgi:2-polyprenyl-3-methyl-5-hydroxy-6-metoxy-1,4-benzoquinol methylase